MPKKELPPGTMTAGEARRLGFRAANEHALSVLYKVDSRAMLVRINRKLKPKGERMKKCAPGSRAYEQHGPYFIVTTDNGITASRVDLATKAREMGLLQPYETLVDV